MALGSMSYSEVSTQADNLQNASTSLTTVFEQLKKEMNSLTDVLKSQSGEELYYTYKELEKKLEGYPGKINEFEKFLRLAVSTYQEDDNKLKSEV